MRWGESLIDIAILTHRNLCRYLSQFRLLNLKVGIRTPQPY